MNLPAFTIYETINEALRGCVPAPISPPIPANDRRDCEAHFHNTCGLTMMRKLPDASVDMVLSDPPYGLTRTAIDPKIDCLEWLTEMRRIAKPRAAIVCFAQQPFTADLVSASRQFDKGSNRFFRQSLVWMKNKSSNYMAARHRHLCRHEDILIFSREACHYFPHQCGAVDVKKVNSRTERKHNTINVVHKPKAGSIYRSLTNAPTSILHYPKDSLIHPFAKPIGLLTHLINAFSKVGDLIVDPTMGSASAAIAAVNNNRRFIGAEIDQTIFKTAMDRFEREAPPHR